MKPQSSLGRKTIHRTPDYNGTEIGKVTSIDKYKKYGIIEVMCLNYSQPAPVWVVGDIDREPVEGDQVLIGFIDGRPDTPYLIGFVKNSSYTTNFITVRKDKIRVQLPVLQATKDVADKLLDETKLNKRAYLELSPSEAKLYFPVNDTGKGAYVKITASGIEIKHDTGNVVINGGTADIARKGDAVSVNVGGTNYSGTITGGNPKIKG